jgi:hypothetical protein
MKQCLAAMKNFLAMFGIVAILTSCVSNGERMSYVSIGMSRPGVVRIVGKPDSDISSGDVEVLHYTQQEAGWFNFSHYFVRLVDGKVESYGSDTSENPVTCSYPSLKK